MLREVQQQEKALVSVEHSAIMKNKRIDALTKKEEYIAKETTEY